MKVDPFKECSDAPLITPESDIRTITYQDVLSVFLREWDEEYACETTTTIAGFGLN